MSRVSVGDHDPGCHVTLGVNLKRLKVGLFWDEEILNLTFTVNVNRAKTSSVSFDKFHSMCVAKKLQVGIGFGSRKFEIKFYSKCKQS